MFGGGHQGSQNKILAKTKRNEANSIEYVIVSPNPTLRSWYGDFQNAHEFAFSVISLIPLSFL